jgi:flagellar hook-length control protein FliK
MSTASPTSPSPTSAPPPLRPGTGAAPPGAPPDGPPFQSALEEHSARTATAEGHQQNPPVKHRLGAAGAQTSAAGPQADAAGEAEAATATATATAAARMPPEAAKPNVTGAVPSSEGHAPAKKAGSKPGSPVAPSIQVPADSALAERTPSAPPTIAPSTAAAAAGGAALGAGPAACLSVATPASGSPTTTTAASATTSLSSPLTQAVPPNTGLSASALENSQQRAGAGVNSGTGVDTTGVNPGTSVNPGAGVNLASPPSTGAPSLPSGIGAGNLPPGTVAGSLLPSTPPSALPTAPTGGPASAPSALAANGAAAAQSANSTAAAPRAALPIPTPAREASRWATAHGAQPGFSSNAPAPARTPAAPASTTNATLPHTDAHVRGPGVPGLGLTPNAGLSAPTGATSSTDALAPQTFSASLGGQAGATPGYGVDLQQTIEAVHATIELATRQGLSSARIALAPAELGEIRIHLSQSSSGLVARVTADTSAAAQALSEGRAELRQSLSSLGLTALHLDTGAFHSGAQGREDHAPPHTESFGPRPSHRASAEEGDQDPLSDSNPDPTPGAPRHSRGALVDVLA